MHTIPIFWTANYLKSQIGNISIGNVDVSSQKFTTSLVEADSFSHRFLFGVSDSKVTVPTRAPYGGAWGDPAEVAGALDLFIYSTRSTFGCTEFEFVFPPSGFADELFEKQIGYLTDIGATLVCTDLSQGIDVDSWDMSLFSKGNRKKLRQFLEAGGQFRRAKESELPKIFEILRLNRENIGAKLSISLLQLQKSFELMPEQYSAWVVTINEKFAAVAVTVRVKQDYEYVYMWGDNLDFRNFSPTAALCEGLICEMKLLGINFLDLGISSLRGENNENLIRFKSNLGAVSTNKLTLNLQI
jgi:hypothetical protein